MLLVWLQRAEAQSDSGPDCSEWAQGSISSSKQQAAHVIEVPFIVMQWTSREALASMKTPAQTPRPHTLSNFIIPSRQHQPARLLWNIGKIKYYCLAPQCPMLHSPITRAGDLLTMALKFTDSATLKFSKHLLVAESLSELIMSSSVPLVFPGQLQTPPRMSTQKSRNYSVNSQVPFQLRCTITRSEIMRNGNPAIGTTPEIPLAF